MLSDIIFSEGYFNNIKRVEMVRIPQESPGMFSEKIIVHFKKWYKFKETFEMDSSEKAKELFDKLSKLVEQTTDLNELIK